MISRDMYDWLRERVRFENAPIIIGPIGAQLKIRSSEFLDMTYEDFAKLEAHLSGDEIAVSNVIPFPVKAP